MRTVLLTSILFLSGCGADKVLHATAGFAIGGLSDDFIGDFGCEAAIAIGLAKELVDPLFSLPDLIATSVYCIMPYL